MRADCGRGHWCLGSASDSLLPWGYPMKINAEKHGFYKYFFKTRQSDFQNSDETRDCSDDGQFHRFTSNPTATGFTVRKGRSADSDIFPPAPIQLDKATPRPPSSRSLSSAAASLNLSLCANNSLNHFNQRCLIHRLRNVIVHARCQK